MGGFWDCQPGIPCGGGGKCLVRVLVGVGSVQRGCMDRRWGLDGRMALVVNTLGNWQFWPLTGRALIDVYGEEITLWVDNEAVTFNLDQTTRYSSTNDKSVNRIDIIDAVCEEYALEFLGFPNSSGGNPTPTSEPFTSEFILEEIEAYLKDDSISPEIDHALCSQ
ncbi:hypothetical protein Tco_1312111 [Tanacetum coccineum]